MILLGLLVTLGSTALAYALANLLVWLLSWVVPIGARLRPVAAWFLLQLALVVGLFVTGDLPGAPRAVLRLLLLMLSISLLLSVCPRWRPKAGQARSGPDCPGPAVWLLAGAMPWLLALLAEAF